MIGESGAIQIPVPSENVFPGYLGHTPKWIVIHKTASGGMAQDVAHFFQTVPDRRSAHYIIGQDGTIVQCVSEADGAGANGSFDPGHAPFLPEDLNLNLVTISIEHSDPTPDNSTPLTDAQKAASFRLVFGICQRHNIPMRKGDSNGGIIGHHDIAPKNRARCPGNYPWDELFSFLENGGPMIDLDNPTVASFFERKDAKTWRSKKTGKTIFGENLTFYRTCGNSALRGLDDLGLPLSEEIPIERLDPDRFGHLAGKGITVKFYELGVTLFDPDDLVDHRPGGGRVKKAHLFEGGIGGETFFRLAQQM